MNKALTCENVCFEFGLKKLFFNVSCSLNKAESLSVIGPNGCGKTTLLKILSGLLKPQSGHVSVFNEELWPQKSYSFEHKSIYLSYTPSFYGRLSVDSNINFYLKCYNHKHSYHQTSTALEMVSLLKKRDILVNYLSSGEKRRLILAIILLLKPNIVFMDEPTNGLDNSGINLCLNIFNLLKQKNNTAFIVATHDTKLIDWSESQLNLSTFKYTKKSDANAIKPITALL